ncbi:GNAT family N-acetyltransferase [Longispora sp. K20-0274]|uniref:GNAT family N-acetyltransferase n=1 Tax=Longispora sp. K20-0274 TaxID=3088255 RepID=UPI0039996E2A
MVDLGLDIRTASGDLFVPFADIVAAKVVPPRPVRYSEIADLERSAAGGWPAPETARLGDWLLRAGAGWTNRANSALTVGDPGVSLEEAVDRVVRWYRERDLVPRFALPLPLARRTDGLLERLGWTAYTPTLVMTRDLALAARDLVVPGLAAEGVRLDAAPDPAWIAMMAGHKGALPAVAAPILTGPEHVAFASLVLDGDLVAIGRGAVTDDWLGLSLVQVHPGHRRRGHAARVVGALADWGRGRGATRAYLQVEEGNAPAVALYGRLGFQVHHNYIHRKMDN